MKDSIRRLLKWSLLGVAALSLAAIVRNSGTGKAPSPVPLAASVEGASMAVYYFHGYARCVTCRKLEQYAHAAVTEGFADEVRAGQMSFSAVNIEETENAHFVQDYKLSSKTIIIQKRGGGKNGAWRNLDRSWELVGDREKFLDYVRGEIRALSENGA